MQPLGSKPLMDAYHAHVASDHDFTVAARVLRMDEKLAGHAVLTGGQINIQRDAMVRRTATFTFHDPDFALALDSASPFEGAIFADRMVQIRHTVDVPGFGAVTAVPFVGPIVKLSRDGDLLSVECQDKTMLAVRGTRPFRAKKHMNAVAAIQAILAQRTGEARFRFPKGVRARLSRTYNVGWSDEAAPWVVCQRIARRELGMQLFYSCDGYATLRKATSAPVFTFDAETNLTSLVTAGYDFSEAVNFARVEVGKVHVATDSLPATHQMSKEALGRNDVPRYLPVLDELSAPGRPKKKAKPKELKRYRTRIRKLSRQAEDRAEAIIDANKALTGDFKWNAVPVYHLDVDDPVALRTPAGGAHLPFSEASIPVLTEGDMACGRVKVLGANRRRGRRG